MSKLDHGHNFFVFILPTLTNIMSNLFGCFVKLNDLHSKRITPFQVSFFEHRPTVTLSTCPV